VAAEQRARACGAAAAIESSRPLPVPRIRRTSAAA